jgi:hypothetical protein
VSLVAVDLAARFSAAVRYTANHHVVGQWDSWQKTEDEFLSDLVLHFLPHNTTPTYLVVEDIPAHVLWSRSVRDVLRIQGRLVQQMSTLGWLSRLVFVQPATWQEHYPGIKRGRGPQQVVQVAAAFGYSPPPLAHRCEASTRTGKPKASERKTAEKVGTDYCAAYLIARWAADFHNTCGHLNAARTTRYHTV